MIPLPQGGAMRRPGTRYVAEIRDSTKKPRLIPFEFSTIQAYIALFENTTIRFFKDQGTIVAADITASITNGAFPDNIDNWTDRSGASSSISHDATNDRLNLISNGTTNGHAEQQVTNSSAVDHSLKFRIFGAPGDIVKLRIGTSSTGTEIVDDIEFEVGYHVHTFTATAADFYVQFLNVAVAKTVQVDDVSLIDNAAIELDSPYLEAELFAIKFAQSADVMYLTHPSHPVYKLTRSAHASWSLVEVAVQDGPYFNQNTTATTLTPSATTGLAVTVTASAVVGINGGDGFKTSDIGRVIRIDNPVSDVKWGWGVIVVFTSTTVVTVDIKVAFATTNADVNWRLGAWSATTGYPGALGFFEQRLGFAGSTDRPQTFWLSQSADFENMSPDNIDDANNGTVETDDAMDFTISADQVNAIRWMATGKNFFIGTAGGEWTVTSDGPLLTPTDIDVKRQTTFGSANISPLQMRGRILFLQRAARRILEFSFSLDLDSFQALDMNLLADHVTKGGIVDMAYQQELDSTLWTVRADGQMPTLTYMPEQSIIGWARQIVGGALRGGIAEVESVAVIPATGNDEVWCVTRRTIDGTDVRYVEYFATAFETGDDPKLAISCDSALTLDAPFSITGATAADPVVVTTSAAHGLSNGDTFTLDEVVGMTELNGNAYTAASVTSTTVELQDLADTPADVDGSDFTAYISGGELRKRVTSITGLDHLEGQSLAILADGAVHPAKTVASGAVTLDYAAGKVVAGLGYTHTYESLKWEAGSPIGTAQGQIKRISGVTLMLLDSMNATIGPDAEHLTTVSFREVKDAMDTAVPLFTGEKFVPFNGDFETDTRVMIRGSDPVPFNLLAVAPEIKTNLR